MINRRDFCSSAMMLASHQAFSRPALKAPSGPVRLKIGLLSDIHIQREASCVNFEKALRLFDGWGADGVVCCGDIADWGVAPQIDLTAKTWFKVFPNGRRSDGRPVANLLHYGDHDCCGYFYRNHPGCREDYPDVDEMRKVAIRWSDRKAIWENAFKEEWAPIVHKNVKGYDFVLSHFTCGEKGNEWGNLVPGLEEFFAALEPKLQKGKPFFYSQHRIPRGTIGGEFLYGQDAGQTTKLFSKYPDLCAFCGHKHLTCTDEQAIWQGAFTCVQVPSLSYCGTQGGRDNGLDDLDKWRAPDWQMPVIPCGRTKQCLMLSVYDDAMVISRRDVLRDKALGPDWVIPLPLSGAERPFEYCNRAASEKPPSFPKGAEISLRRCVKKERDNREHDVFEVTFPPAPAAGGVLRANDYEVRVSVVRRGIERVIAAKRVFSKDYMLMPESDLAPVACDFDADTVVPSAYHPIRFSACPVAAFGTRGEKIVRDFTPDEIGKMTAKNGGKK